MKEIKIDDTMFVVYKEIVYEFRVDEIITRKWGKLYKSHDFQMESPEFREEQIFFTPEEAISYAKDEALEDFKDKMEAIEKYPRKRAW